MTITVTISYSNTPGSKFDMDYYLATHLKLVGACLGDKVISAGAIKGVATPNLGHAAALPSGRNPGG